MHKRIFALLVLKLFSCYSFAQHDLQTSIYTDKGIFTVSRTDDAKDLVTFSCAIWDVMANTTNYSSINLKTSIPKFVIIEIAGKSISPCRSGIGFGCGITAYLPGNDKVSQVDHTNRFCKAILEKTDTHTIKIIFLDDVDWNSLRHDETIP